MPIASRRRLHRYCRSAEIVGLELARRRLDPIDPERLAGELDKLGSQIDQTRDLVAADLAKGDVVQEVYLTKARAERAAASIRATRDLLQYWHSFYAGYDPLFTWWTAAPFKQADAALEKYAAFVNDKSKERPTKDKPIASGRIEPRPIAIGPSDIPDAKSLLAPPSEMAGVIQRYQGEFGRGRMPGFGRRPSSDRQARLTAQREGWLKAMEKIDFDKLSQTGQVDYLLLRDAIKRDLARTKAPATNGPRRPKDGTGIGGRPIGREALLAALSAEMIPYSPEQLVEMANREYAWCEAEMKKASREMGYGDDWKKALEKVKTLHVAPGGQPKVIRDLALEAIDYLPLTI